MLGIENYTCSKREQEQDENAGPSIQKTRAFTAGLPMPDAVVAALQEARRNLGAPLFAWQGEESAQSAGPSAFRLVGCFCWAFSLAGLMDVHPMHIPAGGVHTLDGLGGL